MKCLKLIFCQEVFSLRIIYSFVDWHGPQRLQLAAVSVFYNVLPGAAAD